MGNTRSTKERRTMNKVTKDADITERLAQFAAGLTYEGLSPDVVD